MLCRRRDYHSRSSTYAEPISHGLNEIQHVYINKQNKALDIGQRTDKMQHDDQQNTSRTSYQIQISLRKHSIQYEKALEQTQKAVAVSGCLREAIWKNKHMIIPSKVSQNIQDMSPSNYENEMKESRADTVRTKNTSTRAR
jgi:hypothetical protein